MNSIKETDTQEEQLTPVQQVKNDWRSLVDKLSYNAIVNNIPFIIFLAALCVVYIGNTRRAIEMQRDIAKQSKTLKELHWKYMDIKSQLMYAKMETQVIRTASYIGLKPMMTPAYKVDTAQQTGIKTP